MSKMIFRLLLVGSLVVLPGCASTEQTKVLPNDPEFAPIMPEEQTENIVPTGSLFQANYVNNIYSDAKAHRVGDIISVVLSERTQAQKSANNELTKENTVTLNPITGFGGQSINFKGDAIQFGLTQNSDFSGESEADQSNSLNGYISVNVLRVLPNGNLMIRGEKWMTLNTGDEYIRLTGTIRPQDISSDNTIMSNKVANARIQYSGTGAFAEVQNQGWLSRFINGSWWPL
ncbi:flagellar basal body L-ring protein FlgH [Endozoicomonas sp. G2_1]|uniref:flagellar basal body L-ring protein FlgH n=1 Tax=Endozoicomonas sp. G2_1 TaxID=2821091 RepID=UPI001FFE118E|nr:flagellar basal body L-ring protein FlgH [Endozoicomonas sp. G2_1]